VRDNRDVLAVNSDCSELIHACCGEAQLICTVSLSWPFLLPISDSSMPRSGIGSARAEEGPVASTPVGAANQTAQLGTEPQLALQAQNATAKPAQSNPVQDTVTLSNGVPQTTPAEEAGLFQVAAPAISTLSSASFDGANNGAAPKATDTAAPAANSAQTANAPATNGAQSAPASTTQSQNLLLQFSEYLQQLGLSPQAQSQMIDAARLLNDLDPPAFQQAIVALRTEAASLAAQAGSAPSAQAATPAADAAGNQGGATASTAAAPSAPKSSAGAVRQ